jgi:hypothetical protein
MIAERELMFETEINEYFPKFLVHRKPVNSDQDKELEW